MTRQVAVLWFLGMATALVGLVVYDASWWLVPDEEEARWYDATVGGALVPLTELAGRSDDPLAVLEGVNLPYPVAHLPAAEVPQQVVDTWAHGYLLGYGYRGEDEVLYTALADGSALVWGPMPPWNSVRLAPRHGLSMAVVALLMGLLLAAGLWPLSRAHQALAEAADAYAHGDLDRRLQRGRWVAPELAAAFNRMAVQSQQRVVAHRDLLRAVSHELRTPLARIRLSLHLWTDADPQERAQHEQAMGVDLAELDALIEELLDLARVDIDRPHDPVRLDVLMADLVPNDVELELPTEAVWVLGDAGQIRRAVDNLLRNAREHGGPRVRAALAADGRVQVDDDGPGGGDPSALRAPFAKGPASQGTGLGLAIVERIAARHGTCLELGPSPLGGWQAAVTWPHHPGAPAAAADG